MLGLIAGGASAQGKYKADVPDSITTPDKVETKSLGTTAFLDGIPIASVAALITGLKSAGIKSNDAGITETLLDARTLLLTGNTTVVYIMSPLDLSEGPVVINAPPGMLGLIDDAAFKYVTDIGVAGPDKGKGGKFLILPPGYDGEVPEGYYVAQSKSYANWMVLRAPVNNGEYQPA